MDIAVNWKELWRAARSSRITSILEEKSTKEGRKQVEGLLVAPPNCNEVGAPQVELNGTVGEAPI